MSTQELTTPLTGTPYVSYSYSYPHKMAYRPLSNPVPLGEAWANESREAVFLYMHVPFCEMRCGFCNLFTTANPRASQTSEYLKALARHARATLDSVGAVTVGRMAVGGGTPTYLDCEEIDRLFDIAETVFAADMARVPVSMETSPQTATLEKMKLVRDRGVDRVSIGVQSFVEAEVASVGRGQRTAGVENALANIRNAGIPTLNIDLMYGLPGQTTATWLNSLTAALRSRPQEIYLYPLYVRPLTGLSRTRRQWDDDRVGLYRVGRDFLLTAGYEQVSMRMFRLPAPGAKPADELAGPVYCCQEDGMIGLGCGARSYTTALHYSSEYAVGRTGVKAILADYLDRPVESFQLADHGVALDTGEQRRRYVIASLLQTEGLSLTAYRMRFHTEALHDLPQLGALEGWGLTKSAGGRLRLTDLGLERSDTIGPWLYSDHMHALSREYDPR